MGYVAVQPLVIVKDQSGSMHHVYNGAPVPDGVNPDEIDRLASEGFIAPAGEAVDSDDHPKRRARS